MACPLCAGQTVIETVKRRSGRDWSEVAELGRTLPIPAGLDVRRAYGPSHRPG